MLRDVFPQCARWVVIAGAVFFSSIIAVMAQSAGSPALVGPLWKAVELAGKPVPAANPGREVEQPRPGGDRVGWLQHDQRALRREGRRAHLR
jgi:hypothetical protein